MAEQPILSVRGEAVWEVAPELAELGVEVGARDAARARALEFAHGAASAARTVLDAFADAVVSVETRALGVHPIHDHKDPRSPVAGYLASNRIEVTVSDLGRVGELATRLAELDLVELDGPRWGLRRASEVYRRAHVDAVRDAVARARDYAGALGCELVELVELADSGLVATQPFGQPRRTSGARPEAAARFDLSPARQVVHASVEARFRVTAPDLAAVPPPAGAS